MGSGNINLIGSFLGGMGLMYLISKRNVVGSRNQLLNRFQKGYQNIASDPYLYPSTKEASLRVARGIMNYYQKNPTGNVFSDYDYTKYLEDLSGGEVAIGAVLEQLNRG